MLFFSPKSLEESVKMGYPRRKCRLIHWGEDLEFMKRHVGNISDGGYWLSSGKEHRDFDSIEKAAYKVNEFSELKILRSGYSYLETLDKTIHCRGVVVIPDRIGLKYCTGLTCVVEAFALGKPIISVRNPYFPFDLEKEGAGVYVKENSPDEIVEAIEKIESDSDLYNRLCQNSSRLAEKYNMQIFSIELYNIIENQVL